MKYCPYCGKELKEGADICLKCGKMLVSQTYEEVKENTVKTPGKGKSITGMVLGIIAAIWTFMMLLSLQAGVDGLIYELYYDNLAVYFIAYYIGYSLFSLTPGILSFIFSVLGYKNVKNGIALSGIILSSFALIVCLIVFIIFLVNAAAL